jgi:hypothetical protein
MQSRPRLAQFYACEYLMHISTPSCEAGIVPEDGGILTCSWSWSSLELVLLKKLSVLQPGQAAFSFHL